MERYNRIQPVNGFKDLAYIAITSSKYNDYITYDAHELMTLGASFIQDNEAFSKRNVVRGFGVNLVTPTAKLIHVSQGKIYDVVIDLRKHSNTFMRYYATTLSADDRMELFIPEGFAHAYMALEDSVVCFKTTSYYVKGEELTFAWNSNCFNIPWPLLDNTPILSKQDAENKEFSPAMIEGVA